MKTFLISLILTSAFFSVAQDQENKQFKNDISISGGLSIANQPFGRFGLTYRRFIENTWKLKFSANYDEFYSHNTHHNHTLHSSDSLIIIRDQAVYNNNYSANMGVDKTLFDFLLVGVGLNVGYSSEEIITDDTGLGFDTISQQWESCNGCVHSYHGQPYDFNYSSSSVSDYVRSNNGNSYFTYGILGSLGVYHPIENRWELALQYSFGILRYQSLNNSSSFNKFHHYTDFILRFKI